MPDIHLRIRYDAPPERVWGLVATRESMARWLMPNDFEPVVGHEFRFRGTPRGAWDGVVHSTVLEVDAPRRLAYSWNGAWAETTVRWTLTRTDTGGTELQLDHEGFRGLANFVLSLILRSGWKRKLTISLRQGLSPSPPERCG